MFESSYCMSLFFYVHRDVLTAELWYFWFSFFLTKLPIEYTEFRVRTILKLTPHPCAVCPLLTCSRPHVLKTYLRVQFVYAKRRLCPHTTLCPQFFCRNPLTSLVVFIIAVVSGVMGVLCVETPGHVMLSHCGNSIKLHVTNTFLMWRGDRGSGPWGALTPSDVRLMFIISVNWRCGYWEEIQLPTRPLGRHSALFQCH